MCHLEFEDPQVNKSENRKTDLFVSERAKDRDGDVVHGSGKAVEYVEAGTFENQWLGDFGILIFFDIHSQDSFFAHLAPTLKCAGLSSSLLRSYGGDLPHYKKRLL